MTSSRQFSGGNETADRRLARRGACEATRNSGHSNHYETTLLPFMAGPRFAPVSWTYQLFLLLLSLLIGLFPFALSLALSPGITASLISIAARCTHLNMRFSCVFHAFFMRFSNAVSMRLPRTASPSAMPATVRRHPAGGAWCRGTARGNWMPRHAAVRRLAT